MSKKQLQRVTHAQAEELQAAGFDWLVILLDNEYSFPTVALALEWVREVKGIHCWVRGITYYSRPDKATFITYSGEYFWESVKYRHLPEESTHSQASSVLLDELLTRLGNER